MIPRQVLVQSYRTPVIWRWVIGLALLAAIGGAIAGALRDEEPPLLPLVLVGATAPGVPVDVAGILDERRDDPEALLQVALWLQRHGEDDQRDRAVAAWPAGAGPDRGAIDLVGPLLIAWRDETAPPTLTALATGEEAPRWVNRALGEFHLRYERREAALAAFAREGAAHAAADDARRQAVHLAVVLDRRDLIDRWQDDPRWQSSFTDRWRFERASEAGDWLAALRYLVPSLYEEIDFDFVLIAVAGALGYLAFLFHASYGSERRRELALLCGAGFLLGVVSTWLTIFIIVVQEHHGFTEGEGALATVVYAVLGIGLREEAAKLLCFVPLVPILIRRHHPLAWLLVASSVGVGFAAEENVNYYRASFGGAVAGRFLTANFLHLALTGLCGHALCYGVKWPRHYLGHAVTVFVLAVFAHGAYDAFLMIESIGVLAWGYFIVFVLTGQHYFHALHHERSGGRPDLSLTMVFSLALVFALGVAYVVLSAQVGAFNALRLTGPGLISSAIIVVMFVRGIDDRLSDR